LPVGFRVSFTRAARSELIEAQSWYEGERPGLGRALRTEIDTTVARMAANPFQFPPVHRNVRRALVRRFPYMLFFVVENDLLLVIACFHASRDPQRWQERAT